MSRTLKAEVALVVSVLGLLEFLVFRRYFTGSAIPQFDFTGSYNLEAFAWWHDGSFFNPPQWMRYMYGGYPAATNVQNSSYYLPVGLTSAVTPFTLHASAVLSALHVAFGATGMYVFLRRWGAGIAASTVGLTSWFFAAGFFANATHLDIMRAYAWIPWIMLLTSVKWPWRRSWWTPLVALLMLWQAVLAIYPGMLVALAYTLPIWVAGNQFVYRPKFTRYLLPLALVGASAMLMTLVRFLPALLTRGHYPMHDADTSRLTFGMLGTFLYPELNPRIPWFQEMSSFFLPATILALLAFAPLKNKLVQILLAVATGALLLGLPIWPWHDLLSRVGPGMDTSRFRMADFRLVVLFCGVAVAIFALQGLTHRWSAAPDDAGSAPLAAQSVSSAAWVQAVLRWVPIVLLIMLNAVLAYIGIHYSYKGDPSRKQWMLLALSSVILSVLAEGRRRPRQWFVVALGAMVVLSGLVQANATKVLWMANRTQVEQRSYGSSVDSLVARRDDKTRAQRPARFAIPMQPTNDALIDSHYGVVFYTGESGVIGYLNLRGVETFQLVRQQLYAPGDTGLATRAFWNAAGMAVEGSPDSIPSPEASNACAIGGRCGPDLSVDPIEYGTDGHFVYRLAASADIPVMLNEAHYPGWRARLCPVESPRSCNEVSVKRGSSGQIALEVPRGEWVLHLDYHLPGQSLAWLLFGVGSLIAALTSVSVEVTRRRTKQQVALDLDGPALR